MFWFKEAGTENTLHIYNITQRSFASYNHQLVGATAPAIRETKRDIQREFEHKKIFLAYCGAEPVGSIRLERLNTRSFRFSRLGVLPIYRNSGLGEMLVRIAETAATGMGGKRLYLETALQIKKLVSFYRRLGYSIREVSNDPDYTRVRMGKELQAALSTTARIVDTGTRVA